MVHLQVQEYPHFSDSNSSMTIISSIILGFFLTACLAITCRDENNRPVDWFFVYKLPILQDFPELKDGFGYAYFDAHSHKPELVPSTKSLKDPMSLSYTLAPLYTPNKSKMAFGMYNDDPPFGSASSGYGHVKGTLATDDQSGYWLIHSTPRFPFNSTDSYEFPDFAKIYGQTFICISFSVREFDKIGQALQIMRPKFYETHVPVHLKDKLPQVDAAFDGSYENSPRSLDLSLFSLGGEMFRHLSKTGKWGKCIYEHLVSPTLKADLYVENWMRPWIDSFCPPKYDYTNLNVKEISFGGGRDFGYTKDHSKWAITPGNDWVCIGDMNRMTSQYKRGGGAMCLKNPVLHRAFKGIVKELDKC
ncbi:hypothetical protein GEMRC1_010328 [Eukaryota sp. GEM-RC1]